MRDNINSQQGRPGCSFETAGAYSDCPLPRVLLPAAAVPLGLNQAGISRHWSHHKEGKLTIHKTQLVIDKTQDHIHNGAKLWRETSGGSGGMKLGRNICPSMVVETD